ncbi:GTPase domain-containing protein [Plastoroseomonas hellenica]|uniref:GTPase domain-containing protein n=1 Tax=Plastoroseomonas hellenica TaxID=2687306 RepID=UPI001BAE0AAA|nr:GTPase domain-containing protein [Plastoroseomonas hellenica]MBR0641225.1 GTPase domain-containing protein [Plastoroseomonas hellenica]
MKASTAKEASPLGSSEAVEKPVTIVAVGRQRVGKTTLLNALVQFYRPRGADIRVWNADLQNATNHLGLFHADADTVPPGSFEDTRLWLEARITDQVMERYDAILDVGGGETVLNKLAQEVRLVDTLERRGIRMVAMHVLGPDPADLDYLVRFSNEELFLPRATVLVLNEGLITSGQSAENAFAQIRRHPALLQAVNRGARVRLLPVLSCMGQVASRGLMFSDMANGKQASGHEATSFFDQERTALWWERQMPAFFGELPAEWMPRIRRQAEAA